MGTRSTISARCKDGKVRSIYCHWDGYPSNNGAILLKHYNTQEKVEALLALGDISSLKESTECPYGHSFDTPLPHHTVAYGRDRGETGCEARVYESAYEATEKEHERFDYFWDDVRQGWEVRGAFRLTAELCEQN